MPDTKSLRNILFVLGWHEEEVMRQEDYLWVMRAPYPSTMRLVELQPDHPRGPGFAINPAYYTTLKEGSVTRGFYGYFELTVEAVARAALAGDLKAAKDATKDTTWTNARALRTTLRDALVNADNLLNLISASERLHEGQGA